ncbi:DUF2953 domain-containing protein [Desulfotruncus arcticus]|uniref:DUF2953 domain-containing protein n=1 Tax=Desulfotruncus arcticus TaxID=341036 RepID=UPI0013F4ED32|nr:DUF2953 domain-containing protein [Desulfotruncus arcticus]
MPLGLLSVPVTFKARGAWGPGNKMMNFNLAWGWKLLCTTIGINGREKLIRIRFAGIAFSPPGKKTETTAIKTKTIPKTVPKKISKKKTRRREEKNKFSPAAIKMLLNKELLTVTLGYLIKIIKSIRLRLLVNGVYGTGDPALTGMLAGLIAALHAGHFNLDLEADFSEPIIDIAGEISGRIIPIAIVWFTICIILTKTVRRLWWTHLKTKLISLTAAKTPASHKERGHTC